jgi:hypothetical protein
VQYWYRLPLVQCCIIVWDGVMADDPSEHCLCVVIIIIIIVVVVGPNSEVKRHKTADSRTATSSSMNQLSTNEGQTER